MSFENLAPEERVIIALDCDMESALKLADVLTDEAVWFKVGMTLYYAQGPTIIYKLKERGFKVFLDLKFHDIPHQVRGAAKSAVETGANMLTMHTIGGSEMLRAGAEGAAAAATDFGLDAPVTLGVTVLTSMNEAMPAEVGIARPVSEQVAALADTALGAGLSGVVSSPKEAAMLRAQLGPDAYIVTPGVRPAGSSSDDQKRVLTPSAALAAGASHLVIGRPITQAEDPVAAFRAIVAEIRGSIVK